MEGGWSSDLSDERDFDFFCSTSFLFSFSFCCRYLIGTVHGMQVCRYFIGTIVPTDQVPVPVPALFVLRLIYLPIYDRDPVSLVHQDSVLSVFRAIRQAILRLDPFFRRYVQNECDLFVR